MITSRGISSRSFRILQIEFGAAMTAVGTLDKLSDRSFNRSPQHRQQDGIRRHTL